MILKSFGKTSIIWDEVFEEYKCAKCGAILYYNFDFKACPYCRRKIVKVDERRAQPWAKITMGAQAHGNVRIR